MDLPVITIPSIYVQNIIVVANVSNLSLIGECHDNNANENTQLERLYSQIAKLVNQAAQLHLKTNYSQPKKLGLFSSDDNNLTIKDDCLNNLTRLITNEFMFYTKKRLEPQEFAILFEKIFDLAQKQPGNFHLVLSSFAVRALNNKTMNVVAMIECGQTPQLHFIVKNYDSCVDPIYYENSPDGKKRIEFKNIEFKKDSEKKFPKVKIHGKKHKFSYQNVFEVATLGGLKEFVAIDICFDHIKKVAKKNCLELIKKSCSESKNLIPIQINHIVTANDVKLFEEAMLEKKPTYACPKNTLFYLKKNEWILSHKIVKPEHFFGSPHSQLYVTPLIQSSLLPPELLMLANNHNEKIITALEKKQTKKPKG